MILAAMIASSLPLLEPSGKWIVDYEPSSCTLSRTFGNAGVDEVGLTVRPWPASDSVELVLSAPSKIVDTRLDQFATVTTPDGRSRQRPFVSWRADNSAIRFTQVNADQATLDALGDAGTLSIKTGRYGNARLAVTGLIKARAALKTCLDGLATRWGLDPREPTHIGQPATAIGRESQFVQPSDYPASALYRYAGGSVTLVWAVEIDGRVSDCHAIVPSGAVDIDIAACRAVVTRGRYYPALDKAGQPVRSHVVRTLRFVAG